MTAKSAATRAQAARPQVRLFNVKYSPNLGDGLLSECLEHALIAHGADPASSSLDLAARTQYSAGSVNRSAKMQVLEALPAMIRPLAVRLPLALAARRSWLPHYRSGLGAADCVVIGGGNLLADLDLNFPTKLSLAIKEAARRNVPAFIYGCGVSSGWSAKGRSLMDDALATGAMRKVFVRDERSRGLWDEYFGKSHGLPAGIVRDPGLLAAETYGIAGTSPDGPVGINITSQLAVRYHSKDAPSPQQLDAFYVDCARGLLQAGRTIAVFTNGSPEDRAALAALKPRLSQLPGSGNISYRDATTPGQLVGIIAGLAGIVAFRMHAIIAAFSCGVPFVALSWDPKLDSFVESVGLGDWLCKVTQSGGESAAGQLQAAMARGIDEHSRQQVTAQARQNVATLFAEIEMALV